MWRAAVGLLIGGCGRIGYDPIGDAGVEASIDRDSAPDGDAGDGGIDGDAARDVPSDVGFDGPPDDSTLIAPGRPTRFVVSATDRSLAELAWESAGRDDMHGIVQQEILLFAENTECVGDADETFAVGFDATSATWERLAGSLGTFVRFRVRATNGTGASVASPCSGAIALRNGLVTFDGTLADLALGVPFVADVTGDGGDELTHLAPGANEDRGAIAMLQSGSTFYDEPLRVYAGDHVGDIPVSAPFEHRHVVDLTGDGIPELVLPSPYSFATAVEQGSIFVVPGGPTLPASGTLGASLRRYDGEQSRDTLGYGLVIADLDDDGFRDLVSGSFNGSGSIAGLLRGAYYVVPGGATMPPSGSISAAGRRYDGEVDAARVGYRFAVGEVNGDRYPDVYGCMSDSFAASTFLHVLPGAASFPPSGTLSSAGGRTYSDGNYGLSCAVRLGDVTGDGRNDVIVGGQNGAHVLVGTATGLPAGPALDRYYTGMSLQALADIDGDGLLDLIGPSYSLATEPNGRLDLVLGNDPLPASGDVTAVGRRYLGTAVAPIGYGVMVEDLDGDTLVDLVLGGAGNSVTVFRGAVTLPASGAVDVTARTYGTPYPGQVIPALVDWSGDGRRDLTMLAPAADGDRGVIGLVSGLPPSGPPNAIYEGDRMGDVVGGPISIFQGFTGPALDLDGDGRIDLVSYGPQAAFVLPGRVSPAPSDTISNVARRIDGEFTSAQRVDLTGDGRDEVALLGPTGAGSVVIVSGDGGTIASRLLVGPGDASGFGASAAAGDIDGDGVLDLAIDGSASGPEHHVYVLFGAASLAELTLVRVASTTWGDMQWDDSLVVADVDADGKDDIVLASPASSRVVANGGAWHIALGRFVPR